MLHYDNNRKRFVQTKLRHANIRKTVEKFTARMNKPKLIRYDGNI